MFQRPQWQRSSYQTPDLLLVAFKAHKDHPGSFLGNNFMECPHCLFHVHLSSNGHDLIRHWGKEIDSTPICDADDDRLK